RISYGQILGRGESNEDHRDDDYEHHLQQRKSALDPSMKLIGIHCSRPKLCSEPATFAERAHASKSLGVSSVARPTLSRQWYVGSQGSLQVLRALLLPRSKYRM